MSDIFSHIRLTPAQARTVADRRLGDAECLRKSGDNARANGVFYLGGIVIDCLLKAMLLEEHPELATPLNNDVLSPGGRHVRSLIYRSHELDQMLEALPDLRARLEANDQQHGTRLLDMLTRICETWTIYVRYSPKSTTMEKASRFLDQVREVRPWLR